jgi:two-component system response regulator CpxR
MEDTAMRVPNSTRPTLLLIDDDRELCDLVSRYLATEGFDSTAVHTGGEGERAALAGGFDLIVLDVMLPDCKGFDVLREIRKSLTTPVLMLTAKGDSFDRILGLELGADDYVPKPFNSRELSARISAILRRSERHSLSIASQRPATVKVGDLELDPSGRAVTMEGQELKLTSAEFDLLRLFLESAGEVLSREMLVEQVLDKKYSPFERSIEFHISNLRRKLGPQKNGRERIRSVRGTGYLYAWPKA